ncbi:hypothetical protein LINPERHAP2_LOCUS5097 [Linum perenne]
MGRWVMRPLHYDRPDYDSDPTSKLFTIELHYGGVLIGNDYKYGLTSYFDLVEADTFSLHDLNKMTKFVGVYGGIFEYLWLVPGEDIPAALKPLHCDDDIRTLIEGLTPARTVRVYINKLSEFQARRRLAQVQLRLFEVVTRRRGVVIEEVMEAGGNGPGEGVVGSGNVSRARRLLRMSWAQLQIQSLKTNKAQWLRPPPIHRSPNSPTSPPPTHTPPPEIPVNPTSPPLTHTPPPERPVKPTSPPLTHSPPQENLDTPPLYEDDSSGYSYSSEDESFRADERELGDESSENEAFEYDEDEVDSEVDNVLRRRASSSSNQVPGSNEQPRWHVFTYNWGTLNWIYFRRYSNCENDSKQDMISSPLKDAADCSLPTLSIFICRSYCQQTIDDLFCSVFNRCVNPHEEIASVLVHFISPPTAEESPTWVVFCP